jgi:hypothetical protein
VLGADEPVELGGMDSGADAFELLLAALGACTAMTIRMYASRKGLRLDRAACNCGMFSARPVATSRIASSASSPWMASDCRGTTASAHDRGTMPRQPDAEAQLRHHDAAGGGNSGARCFVSGLR